MGTAFTHELTWLARTGHVATGDLGDEMTWRVRRQASADEVAAHVARGASLSGKFVAESEAGTARGSTSKERGADVAGRHPLCHVGLSFSPLYIYSTQ